MRAVLLSLVDQLEKHAKFIDFLKNNEFLTEEAYKDIQKGYSIEDEVKDHSSKQQNVPATLQSTSSSSDIKKQITDSNYIDRLIKKFAKSKNFKEVRKTCKELLNFAKQINEKQVNDIALSLFRYNGLLSIMSLKILNPF
jgi:hypothetical protein